MEICTCIGKSHTHTQKKKYLEYHLTTWHSISLKVCHFSSMQISLASLQDCENFLHLIIKTVAYNFLLFYPLNLLKNSLSYKRSFSLIFLHTSWRANSYIFLFIMRHLLTLTTLKERMYTKYPLILNGRNASRWQYVRGYMQ